MLAQGTFFMIASGSVLKPLGLLVKMIKPSNISNHPNHKIENFEVSIGTPVPPDTVQFNDFVLFTSHHKHFYRVKIII